MMFKRMLPLIILIFVFAACNATADDSVTVQEIESVAQEATDAPTVEVNAEPIEVQPTLEATAVPTLMPPTDVPRLEATAAPESSAYAAPEWASLVLVNARTGESFTLADFAGKTVFVEPMATWCPNCRAQQGYVSQAMASLSDDDFVFISLSVGENVSNEALANYAQQNSFPQIFAVASSEITSALVAQFGFSVTSPPSTPHFTISPIGTVSSLRTGFHQASAIIEEVTNAQNS